MTSGQVHDEYEYFQWGVVSLGVGAGVALVVFILGGLLREVVGLDLGPLAVPWRWSVLVLGWALIAGVWLYEFLTLAVLVVAPAGLLYLGLRALVDRYGEAPPSAAPAAWVVPALVATLGGLAWVALAGPPTGVVLLLAVPTVASLSVRTAVYVESGSGTGGDGDRSRAPLLAVAVPVGALLTAGLVPGEYLPAGETVGGALDPVGGLPVPALLGRVTALPGAEVVLAALLPGLVVSLATLSVRVAGDLAGSGGDRGSGDGDAGRVAGASEVAFSEGLHSLTYGFDVRLARATVGGDPTLFVALPGDADREAVEDLTDTAPDWRFHDPERVSPSLFDGPDEACWYVEDSPAAREAVADALGVDPSTVLGPAPDGAGDSATDRY